MLWLTLKKQQQQTKGHIQKMLHYLINVVLQQLEMVVVMQSKSQHQGIGESMNAPQNELERVCNEEKAPPSGSSQSNWALYPLKKKKKQYVKEYSAVRAWGHTRHMDICVLHQSIKAG